MAAGLSIKTNHFSDFVERTNTFIFTKVSTKVYTPVYYYDLDINSSDLNGSFYSDMQKLEPFGLDNYKPLLRLVSNDIRITPLKKFINHYNITIDKVVSLIYFNCQEKYFSLKYSKYRSFIFEIQDKIEGQIKGIVKNFDGGFEFDKSFSSSLDAFIFEQLNYLNNKSVVDKKSYSASEMVEVVAECEANPFGTIFVSTSSQSYKNFTQNYYSENIRELFVFNNSSDSGYNALYLYPTDLTIFKNYNKIFFLDPVLDKSYLSEIKKYSNGEIYLPESAQFDKQIFSNLNLSRNAILDFYMKLKTLNYQCFSNVLHLYNVISKITKISFNNFYIYYLILSELNIIKLLPGDQLTLQINFKKKTELNSSSIYNLVNYLNQITK
jgi:hypothetical protein